MPSNPIPLKRPHTIIQHGKTRVDEYYWMRDREDAEVVQYLQAENEYLTGVLQHTKTLQEKLFQEMKGFIKETDSSVPEKKEDYFYYTRTEANKQYPLFCRKKGSINAPEEILLDQNVLADKSEFCSVGAYSISPDQSKLAFSVDLKGAEVYTIYIKNLEDGSLYPETISNTYGSVYFMGGVEWTTDSETLYYLALDTFHRACKLYRHKLGTDSAEDRLLFFEEDETFSLFLFKTRSEQYIMTHHYNTISQEMRFISANEPEAELRVIQPRKKGLEYFGTHFGNSFLLITNENAPNFKLIETPVPAPGMENWREVIGNRANVLLEDIDTFEKHIVLHERKDGLKQLRICKTDDIINALYISFPDPAYDVTVEANPEFNTNLLRIRYSSLITPFSIVDIHMDTGQWVLKKEYEIPNGYNKNQYATEVIEAGTSDGKKISISIVYKKGIIKDGQNPTLLYGYGAYGASCDATFNPNLICLLDRGFVFAIGHVRGGSELGRDWYDNGRLLNKKNSFTDFIACAEKLITEGFTSPKKLAITGGSAGGLLVGACMTMRPELFEAVICKVPFLDVVTSMSDPTIPLTSLEYDQWGNPDNKEEFDYMLSYSPYENIRSVEYPNILLTTGFNDPRVAYWEPAKFLARIRDRKKGDNWAIMQTNFNAGHAGASGRYDSLEEYVLDFAFLIDRLT
jgi:oligopeptidase B